MGTGSGDGMVIAVRMRPLVHVTAELKAYEYKGGQSLKDLTFIEIPTEGDASCGVEEVKGQSVVSCFYVQVCLTYHPSPGRKLHPDLAAIYVDTLG